LELIRKEVSPGTIALAITGEVRTSNDRQQLTQGVEEEIQKGVRRIIIDLGALQIVDSAGIGSIVLCFSHVKKAGGTLRLAGAKGMVENVLKLTQIHRAIDLFPSVEEASKNFPGSN
jgi:anti-sigma B factor antagonist